jgi:MarR family transcriptional regulator, organic hydroperoxide resistance regulator
MENGNKIRKVGMRQVWTRQAETRLATLRMKRILIHFRGQMDEVLRPQGVTTAQLQLLKTVQSEPGASGAQLARSCYMTPQSAQALLKGLEDGGWIVRVKDKVNDRILVARLTSSGEELLETADKAARVIEQRVWQGVTDSEIRSLNEVLEDCLANLETGSEVRQS